MKVTHITHAGYVIELDDGKVWLYDTSTHARSWQIIRYLWRELKVRRIEGIVLSHYHFDHMGGASRIIEYFRGAVGGVYSAKAYSGSGASTFDDDSPRQDALDSAITKHGIPHTQVERGDVLANGLVEIVSPEPGIVDSLPTDGEGRNVTDNPNDEHVCIARFVHGSFSFMGTGDTGPEGTKKGFTDAIASPVSVQATVMSWPHHGDGDYMTPTILQAVSPSLVLLEGNPNVEAAKTMADDESIPYVEFDAEDPYWQLDADTDGTWTTGNVSVPSLSRGVPSLI